MSAVVAANFSVLGIKSEYNRMQWQADCILLGVHSVAVTKGLITVIAMRVQALEKQMAHTNE